MSAVEVPLDAVEEALRCTSHIKDRHIRAAYIATDMRLRGWVIQRVRRDDNGRFVRAEAAS